MQKYSLSKGFTLIELLVVIAILGILAAVVLVAINPAQRIAEANDTKMKSAVSSVATAVEACYTQTATGDYTGCDSGAKLVTGGFLKVTPNPAPTFLPRVTTETEMKVYGQLTAVSARPAGCSTNPYVVYNSVDGTTQIQCAAPTAP